MFSRKPKPHVRRGAVRKTENRIRRQHVFAVVGTVAAVAVTGFLAWQLYKYEPETLLPIEHVAIEGSFENLAADALQARVSDVLQGGYFTVNLQTIRDALLQMPWVEEVSIRRLWPPSLNIRVTEKRAVAYWGSDALISDKGVLFSPQPLSHQVHLPQLEGPELLHKKVWQFAAEVSTQLIKLGMHTEKVSLDDRRAWRVYVARDGADNQQKKDLIEINFGSTDTEQRLQRFLHVFAMRKAPDLNNIQVVDMRYPNGFALRANNNKERGA